MGGYEPRQPSGGPQAQPRIEPSFSATPPVSIDTTSEPSQANKREDKDFRKAKRHSLFVSTMRKALPALALVWAGIFGVNAVFSLSNLPELSVESAGIEGGKLVMKAPVMSGFDKKNRPFDITANRAIQDLSDTKIVDLENINAVLPLDAKSKARVLADFGTYDTESETMKLRKNIKISGANGMDISLKSADIDMKSGKMHSDEAVTVKSNEMTISADSVTVEDNGDRILFKKRVTTTFQPKSSPVTN